MRSNAPILLVEDDRVDVMTVQRALRDIKITNPVRVAGNGEEALTILRDDEERRPCLILLDLRMPRMGGIEFLRVVKKDESLKRIPVVVLTTSREERDRVESFELGVAGYMVKPVHYEGFMEIIRTIDLYWTLSHLPPECE
ncbi:MAG: response regulator [Anaerolineales bacterium]